MIAADCVDFVTAALQNSICVIVALCSGIYVFAVFRRLIVDVRQDGFLFNINCTPFLRILDRGAMLQVG